MIDSHIRFNDFYGEVKMRPNWKEDDSYEFVDFDTVIYECHRIKTEEDSGAILGLEDMSTYVIKPESILIIRTEEDNTSRFELIVGALWGNVKKMIRGESIKCEMSHCVMGIDDEYDTFPSELATYFNEHPISWYEERGIGIPNRHLFKGNTKEDNVIFAAEVKNGVATAYVFKGSMIVRNKNNKVYEIIAGESGSIGKDSKIVVKKFDVNKVAKKFGITNAVLHGQVTTTTTVTKRYDVEQAIVKYKVTKGNQQGTMAKVFDNYGQLERRELKMGDQMTLQLTQGNTSYNLDRQTKTYQQVTNAELNFLNMNAPVMQKLKLQKKGTAKVLDKDCTIYANSDTEYYVWKGIVLKKVQRSSNGTTTTEATSVELPASVDAKYFKMPEGYRKK